MGRSRERFKLQELPQALYWTFQCSPNGDMNVRSYIAFCISKVAPCSGRFMCNTLKLVLSIVQSSPFFWRVFCKGCLFGFAAFAAFAFAFVAFAFVAFDLAFASFARAFVTSAAFCSFTAFLLSCCILSIILFLIRSSCCLRCHFLSIFYACVFFFVALVRCHQ